MRDLAVLIPVYNDSESLAETLASISEADNSFTVVVVDDGSDTPVEIENDKYPFEIVVLRQNPNGGIVKALNRGIEYIRSKDFAFIARLDAADLQRPDRLGIEYAFLQANPDIDLVGSNVTFMDEDSLEPIFTTNLPATDKEIKRWIVFRNCFIHPSVIFRSTVVDKTGIYSAEYPHIEDYDFFSRIIRNHKTANLQEPLMDCFIRRSGISILNQRTQLLAGIRYRIHHPRPLNPLWHAYLIKRISYFVVPHPVRNKLKTVLGFTRKPSELLPGR